MLSYAFVLALFVPALVSAQTQGILPCQDASGNLLPSSQSLTVDGCAQAPCDVFQGSDAVMHANFRALNGANALRPEVYATALGTTIEYVLPPQFQDGCQSLQPGSCPMAPNEDATYHFNFPITPIYPPIPVSVQLTLFDHAQRPVFCNIINIHVRIRQ